MHVSPNMCISNYNLYKRSVLSLGVFLICKLLISDLRAQTSGPYNASTFSNMALSGSTTNWVNTENAENSDNRYASVATNSLSGNGDYTDYFYASNFKFSLPLGAVIYGIEIQIERGDVNNCKDHSVRIVKGGVPGSENKAVSPAWSSEATRTYGGVADLWSDIWTASDINSADFGIVFSVKKQGGGANPQPRIDHVSIVVYHSSALPVELLNFSANEKMDQCELNWKTASEINNSHYIIERSSDLENWAPLRMVQGNGNSSSITAYAYIDKDPIPGQSYYRLIQYDHDGTETIFDPVSFFFEVAFDIQLYPNPNNGVFQISGKNLDNMSVSIFDDKGKRITTQSFNDHGETKKFDISFLDQGFYIINLKHGHGVISKRILVIN